MNALVVQWWRHKHGTKEKEIDKGKEVQDQLITMSKQGQRGAGSIDFNVLESFLGGVNQAIFLLGCVCKSV